MKTIPLSTPVDIGGHVHTELVFKREPTFGDLRACAIEPSTILSINMILVTGKGGLTSDQIVLLASRLSGQGEAMLNGISARDMVDVHEALIDFFSPAEADSAGQESTATEKP